MKTKSRLRCVVLSLLACASVLPPSLLAAPADQRITALSSRAIGGSGNYAITSGFVVGPGAPKKILLRAVGPGLVGRDSVFGALNDPRLTLYDAGGAVLAANDNWQAADAATSAE